MKIARGSIDLQRQTVTHHRCGDRKANQTRAGHRTRYPCLPICIFIMPALRHAVRMQKSKRLRTAVAFSASCGGGPGISGYETIVKVFFFFASCTTISCLFLRAQIFCSERVYPGSSVDLILLLLMQRSCSMLSKLL